jgi:hypothetical protein
MRPITRVGLLALPAVAALVAACGGGGSSDTTPPPMPSAEEQANASVAAWLNYTRRQIAGETSDTTEARSVDTLQPPVSDDDDPANV